MAKNDDLNDEKDLNIAPGASGGATAGEKLMLG